MATLARSFSLDFFPLLSSRPTRFSLVAFFGGKPTFRYSTHNDNPRNHFCSCSLPGPSRASSAARPTSDNLFLFTSLSHCFFLDLLLSRRTSLGSCGRFTRTHQSAVKVKSHADVTAKWLQCQIKLILLVHFPPLSNVPLNLLLLVFSFKTDLKEQSGYLTHSTLLKESKSVMSL